MIDAGYWVENISTVEAARNLDIRYSWFVTHFLAIGNEEVQTELKKLQSEGVKIMIHVPLCYVNIRYLQDPLWKELHQQITNIDGWLKDANGNKVGNPSQFVNLRDPQIAQYMAFRMARQVAKWNFVPDAWFVDYICDTITWAGDFDEPEIVNREWKAGNYFAAHALKFYIKFSNAGAFRNCLFYGNGNHNCQSMDAKAYEHFPITNSDGGRRGVDVELFGELGILNHRRLFKRPPMLLPAYGNGVGTDIPLDNLINTVTFANSFCSDAIIVDNSEQIFDIIVELE